jgi:hypothetical protein
MGQTFLRESRQLVRNRKNDLKTSIDNENEKMFDHV